MKFSLLFWLLCLSSFSFAQQRQIAETLDSWHKAAADSQFDTYFSLMSPDAVFIGTDASENWDRKAFMAYAKVPFEKGRGWKMTPVERHIFVDTDGQTAWFNELLDTRMGLCQGSGVLKKSGENWRIVHYVLSMTVPNDQADAVIAVKKEWDANFLTCLSQARK